MSDDDDNNNDRNDEPQDFLVYLSSYPQRKQKDPRHQLGTATLHHH